MLHGVTVLIYSLLKEIKNGYEEDVFRRLIFHIPMQPLTVIRPQKWLFQPSLREARPRKALISNARLKPEKRLASEANKSPSQARLVAYYHLPSKILPETQ